MCYLIWHDYPSLVGGESHIILFYLLLIFFLAKLRTLFSGDWFGQSCIFYYSLYSIITSLLHIKSFQYYCSIYVIYFECNFLVSLSMSYKRRHVVIYAVACKFQDSFVSYG